MADRARNRLPAAHVPMTFTAAFETYAPFTWNVLALLGVAPADVPDVCQEVFLVLHRRWSEVDTDRSLKSWLYAVCVRKVAEYRRHRRARPEVVTAEPPELRVEGSAEDVVDRKHAARLLDHALDQLDDDRRAVFVLYEIEELSIAEVATTIGCPLQTAYSRLRAARALVTDIFTRASKATTPIGTNRRGR
ncbi:MAG TPA: sigma-70 family RNA polymerase sigma factor [Polyangia bacterium]|nr:sigma-70 family RNA polymerase sigma factor [Polyangia bacterium]